MSPSWHLEFGGGSYMFGIYVHPCYDFDGSVTISEQSAK
jgi:hypothetical protein